MTKKHSERLTIVRTVKTASDTVLNNTAANDSRLSFKAVGIHTYLMTKPDDWQVYGSYLANTHTDGRDSVYAGLKELEKFGYLVRRVRRDECGKIIGRESVVYERPQRMDHEDDAPQSPSQADNSPYSGFSVIRENPVTENPCYGKTLLRKTRSY